MLSKEQLKQVLADQRESILRKDFGVERQALKEMDSKIRLPHVVVITGLRRSGKSTLLRQVIKRYYGDDDFYYVNFEDERLFNFEATQFNAVYESLLELFGKKSAFFIDEIQNIANFETFVRRFSEDGFKFFVTGSSAKLLSRELSTKLAGRHIDIPIKPFSFAEYLKFRGTEFEGASAYKTESRVRIKKRFDDYLSWGGMPEYLAYQESELLGRTYEDIVIKDVAIRHGVENVQQLKELCQYLTTNFARKFSYNSLREATGMGSVSTVQKYVSYLEETYFAQTASKFDYSLKKRARNDKKLYVADNGFVSLLAKNTTADRGRLLENLIFNALSGEGREIFYYCGKRECDFVLVSGRKVRQAIQVCYELGDENEDREKDGLAEAMEAFNLKEGLILTADQEGEDKTGNGDIRIMPAWKWLLQK